MLALRVLAIVAGAILVGATVLSAVQTLVVPRSTPVRLTRAVFLAVRLVLRLRARPSRPYEERDRVMALFAPLSLLALLVAWVVVVAGAFTLVLWGVSGGTVGDAFTFSGSSIFTLGFDRPDSVGLQALCFVEAALGLTLVALLISYLPSIYAAFARREREVSMLEALAGSPPSALEMIVRHHVIAGLDRLEQVWPRWAEWFADIEESHTSIAALVFFRSPLSERSWVTAAGCVLDGASVYVSAVDRPPSPDAQLCIRAGYVALRRIADFFNIPHPSNPRPDDPISVTRPEFERFCNALAANGVPLRGDRDQAWRDFAGWRVNYDVVLRALAGLVMAPVAPWSSDRPLPYRRPPLLRASTRRRHR